MLINIIVDPIPGGCSTTFDFDIAPYQIVTYTTELIIVDAQSASINNHICEEQLDNLEMYHLYLDEWVFSEDQYFEGIQQMITVKAIKENGRKVPEPYGASNLRRYYNAYVGTGSVFAIIAKYGNYSSAYIPAVTYACDVSMGNETCYDPGNF